ncbi:MAG TPA: hypothetical protein VFG43_16590 [Geminicoccaceae bacterium]|nr:hypothetical protein [Geminicoccaceae bacterium]
MILHERTHRRARFQNEPAPGSEFENCTNELEKPLIFNVRRSAPLRLAGAGAAAVDAGAQASASSGRPR